MCDKRALTRTFVASGVERAGRALAALACLVWLSTASAARAEWLAVERAEGAENCPDTSGLAGQVLAIRAHAASGAEAARDAYQVHFGREGDTLVAELRARTDAAHVRTLTARGTSCEPLAQAVAVALALLLDSEPPSSPPPPPAPVAALAPAPAEAQRPQSAAEPALRALLALGAGPLLGVTRLVAPALEGELGLWHARFRASLGVLGVPLQREPFGPGSLRSWQLAGSAKGCLMLVTAAPWRLDLCSGLYAGVIDVRARGYTQNDQRKQAWLAIPLEASGQLTLGPVALALAAGALFPMRRPEFSIDGLGAAYEAWPVSLLISLKLVLALPSFGSAQKK
jgi:hypothetical protein